MSEGSMIEGRQLEALPYAWPFDESFAPNSTALVLIDWQVDFCGPGGYVDRSPRPARGTATLITPPSLVALLKTERTPLVPLLHPSAL